MVHNTPSGIDYQCGDAGMRSKVVANHGMYGAYPTWPDSPSYAHGTNVKELIDARKPLVHGRGPASNPDIAVNIEATELETEAQPPFVTPEPLQNYDLIVHPISGAQSMGDPIERDVSAIEDDLNKGWTSIRVATEIHGAVVSLNGGYTVDVAATKRRRAEIREERKRKAVPFKEWWASEREKVAAKENMNPAVLDMWRSSIALSPDYGAELHAFWNLPDDFEF